MNPATEKRIAMRERQLTRYLARALPPTDNPQALKRRATFRRRVIRDFLRQIRCLTQRGNEIGWRQTVLTEEDDARAEQLMTMFADQTLQGEKP